MDERGEAAARLSVCNFGGGPVRDRKDSSGCVCTIASFAAGCVGSRSGDDTGVAESSGLVAAVCDGVGVGVCSGVGVGRGLGVGVCDGTRAGIFSGIGVAVCAGGRGEGVCAGVAVERGLGDCVAAAPLAVLPSRNVVCNFFPFAT